MPRTKKPIDVPAQIERMVKRIVKKFHPEKIILFGSQARGEAGPDSDVDLLVVMSLDGSKREKAHEILEALDDIVVPTDVIVTSPEDFAWRKDIVGTIEWPAANEGKVLYESWAPWNDWPQRSEEELMPYPKKVITTIQEWLLKADNDLKAAVHLLALKEDAPTDAVCFHAQQCIEKYLKTLLVFQAIPFTKTHDLRVLMRLMPAKLRPRLQSKDRARITKYAVVTRYPRAGKEISLAQARKEVAIARRVRREVRRFLPRAALRRRKK
jgi:HEPN domain-containing protein/predicted nucleotidyltransferase